MNLRIAVLSELLVLTVCLPGAQPARPNSPWNGTITETINAEEPGYKSVATINCTLSGTSARCTYAGTETKSGKGAFEITRSATQDHLQVSVVPAKDGWKLLVAAFISRGTATIKANGKSMSGGDVAVQAPNWEVPLSVPRNPNQLSGTWKNSLGDVIQWELSR